MKIRGNTVGTPLKPEVAVVKAKNLTEEQKAQARENIRAADDVFVSQTFDMMSKQQGANTNAINMIGKKLDDLESAVLYTEQTLTEEQKQQARENIDVPSYQEFEYHRDDYLLLTSKHEEDILAIDGRVDKLEQGYRHIVTYEHTADEGVAQIHITQDKDGNAFACSDLIIFLTLPTSDDINTNYRTQLYIGHEIYKWDAFIPGGFSRTATRRMRVHLYHLSGGYWLTDGVLLELESYADYHASNIYGYENVTFGTIKGLQTTKTTASEMHFQAQSAFNKGTKIEIYGK